MVILSFLGHAYVWGEDTIVESLPPSLAVPWHRLALMLGRPPVLSYASYALDNWRRIERKNPIEYRTPAEFSRRPRRGVVRAHPYSH